jgi:hypothetical protein
MDGDPARCSDEEATFRLALELGTWRRFRKTKFTERII